MIDYLKLERSLKPFYDYKAEKEYEEKTDKIEKILLYIFGFLIILIMIISFIIFKDISEFFSFSFITSFIVLVAVFTPIVVITCHKKDFQSDNYETEENLKKVSEFGIKNVTNFKENIFLLRRKTEYMLLDEKNKRTEEYSPKEIYINKILNIFYGTDKTDLKKQDMELLELLKK